MSHKQARPFAEVLHIAEQLLGLLRESCERITLAGSLRRRKPEVGDIELCAIPKLGLLRKETDMDIFGTARVVEVRGSLLWARLDGLLPAGAYSKRGEKYRQFDFEGVQVDCFTAEGGNFGWIQLIRTGSAEFSHRMASTLNHKGYTSRDGWIEAIGTPGKRIETPEERDVFKLAGICYLEPNQRSR